MAGWVGAWAVGRMERVVAGADHFSIRSHRCDEARIETTVWISVELVWVIFRFDATGATRCRSRSSLGTCATRRSLRLLFGLATGPARVILRYEATGALRRGSRQLLDLVTGLERIILRFVVTGVTRRGSRPLSELVPGWRGSFFDSKPAVRRGAG